MNKPRVTLDTIIAFVLAVMMFVMCFLSTTCRVFSDEWKFEIVPQPVVVTVAPKKRFLAFFTASYCGPCQSWKATEKHKLESAGWHVRTYEMTETKWKARYGSRIRRFPTFIVCDWKTGAWIGEPIVGSVPSASLLPLLNVDVVVKTKTIERTPNLFGRVGTSHESRETLIKHLFNDGIHAGKHSLSNLNNMSDVELDKLHSSDHNNQN